MKTDYKIFHGHITKIDADEWIAILTCEGEDDMEATFDSKAVSKGQRRQYLT